MRRNIVAGRQAAGGLGFSVLSDDDLDRIHAATLEVMCKTGIFVEDEEALEVFDGGGIAVDRKAKSAKIPPHVLEDAVRSAPEVVVLAGRNPENDIVLEKGRVGVACFGEGIMVNDPETGEHREPTKADLADASRLVDYLEHIDVFHRIMGAHDVPQSVVPVHNLEAMLLNSTKHIMIGSFSGYLTKKCVDMAAAVVGGKDRLKERPLVTFGTTPVTPLKLVRDTCEVIMETARAGQVLMLLSQGMAGGSSAVTLAGTLVTHNVEVLSGLVLNQLVQKGAPFIYGSSTCTMDLRNGAASVGSPETALVSAAIAQMARYYLLPSYIAGG